MIINKEQVIAIVREASLLFTNRKSAGEVQKKGWSDYVTEVDLSVQKFIQSKLQNVYPEIQFMGEEKSNHEIDFSGSVWVLDPVDGTTNLIHDYKQSAISLALIVNRSVMMGIVYQPYTDELFYAERGKGAFLNGEKITVSQTEEMSECLISIGTSPYYPELIEENFAIFSRIFRDIQDIRRCGSAAIDLAYVACGRIEAYFEKRLKLWDFAAGMLLVEEAGGLVLQHSGEPVEIALMEDIVAGNNRICQMLVQRYFKKR